MAGGGHASLAVEWRSLKAKTWGLGCDNNGHDVSSSLPNSLNAMA